MDHDTPTRERGNFRWKSGTGGRGASSGGPHGTVAVAFRINWGDVTDRRAEAEFRQVYGNRFGQPAPEPVIVLRTNSIGEAKEPLKIRKGATVLMLTSKQSVAERAQSGKYTARRVAVIKVVLGI